MDRIILVQLQRRYRFRNLVFDLFMIGLTSGLWLVWVFFREMRSK